MKKSVIKLSVLCAIALIVLSSLRSSSATTKPLFTLRDPGTEKVVEYEKYGTFSGIGTFDYAYTIQDPAGLAKASGEGIDPDTGIPGDPAYQKLLSEGRIRKDPWKHIDSGDPEADFFAWAAVQTKTGQIDPGVRLFFTARALESAGLYEHALKAYRAAMILYPGDLCWNRSRTWTWLIAPAAWNAIIDLTRMRPELGLRLVDSFVDVESAIGGDPAKNRVAVTPGRLVPDTAADRRKRTLSSAEIAKLEVIERRGGGKVACVKYENGQWGLQVDGKPFAVRGVTYTPVRVGQNYSWNWMAEDEDRNGMNDAAYETWVDTNRNNRRDDDEPVVGDFALLKAMGCNTIRVFNSNEINKPLLRDLFATYGIRALICDFFGAYTVHSMANWNDGTDYTHPEQRQLMKDAILATVRECKDEPWLLGYILGNENNMPIEYSGVNATRTQAAHQPKEYASFLNEVAREIHALDPDHPVGVGNVGLSIVGEYARYAPELDFIGVNDYPGANGFGGLWIRAKRLIDRPVLVTEFGCDAYRTGKGVDEEMQAEYLRNGWEDIAYNLAGAPGEGNALGGLVFEWSDEWWKDTRGDPPDRQNTEPTMEMAFPDGWSQEEFYGIVGQGDGLKTPFLRQPRKAYYVLQELWTR